MPAERGGTFDADASVPVHRLGPARPSRHALAPFLPLTALVSPLADLALRGSLVSH